VPTAVVRARRSLRRSRAQRRAEPGDPLPMVEVVLGGLDREDWVMEALRVEGLSFRLLACRPTDRGRKRLLRLFEVRTNGEGLTPVVRRLGLRLSPQDVRVSSLGPDRALLRVAVPIPAICSAAFDLGDFCITCPFLRTEEGKGGSSWNVLVPEIADARRLLSASSETTSAPASLVRAGAYRRRWGLTVRQEDALRAALRLGYFEYPRRSSLSPVAAELGVGRSTALELLRRATAKVAAERFRTEPLLGRLSG
jgi:hypothetical protein